jgi:hypothetical protein
MMARYALVCDDCGHVVNVVEWEEGSDVAAPPGHTLVADVNATASAGAINNGTNEFQPAPGLVPAEPKE